MKKIQARPIRYIPFDHGKHSTAPSLKPLGRGSAGPVDHVFQVDCGYKKFIENKRKLKCRKAPACCLEDRFARSTAYEVCRFMVDRTAKENSAYFKWTRAGRDYVFENLITGEAFRFNDRFQYNGPEYASLFDALCMQHQEDVAVLQLDEKSDWLSALHICAPNYWWPTEKIGKSFEAVHEPVPDMDKVKKNYRPLIEHIVRNDAVYERFGWGFSEDDMLAHIHRPTTYRNTLKKMEILGQGVQEKTGFVRIERQVLIGLKRVNALLFTIRTYFQSIEDLEKGEKNALRMAVEDMSDKMREYKGLGNKLDKIIEKLS